MKLKSLLFATLLTLLGASPSFSQVLTIHNAPQGVTQFANPSTWPLVSGQCQWMNMDANHDDMWHTHAEFATNGKEPGFPIWAELGDQPITVPVSIQVRGIPGIAGEVTDIWGEYANHLRIPVVMDTPGPYVSDPTIYPAAKIYTGHLSFNIADAQRNDTTGLVPLHGWTTVTLKTRTAMSNGDAVDNETDVPVFSVIDPKQPEPPLAEAGIPFQAKCIRGIAANTSLATIFGIHLVEFRDQRIPLLAPFSGPIVERVFGYSYGFNSAIPASDFEYTATLDPNAHVTPKLPGSPLPTVSFGNGGNFDTLDPAAIAAHPPLAGLKPNQHVLFLAWDGDTSKSNGFVSEAPEAGINVPSGIEIKAALKLLITTGVNPQPAGPLQLLPVPYLYGLTPEQAEAAITAAGFAVGNVGFNDTANRPGLQAGIVWTQEPSPSAQGLPAGTEISIGISGGAGTPPVVTPPPVIIPPVPVPVPIVGSISRPVTASEETIDNVPDGKLTICVGSVCKVF